MNFARLNHILIPASKAERDRLRQGWAGRIMRPFGWLNDAFTTEGGSLLILLSMIGMSGLDVHRTQVYVLWAVLSGLVVASVLARPLFRAKGLEIEVRTSPRVAVGEPLRFDMQLLNSSDSDLHALRILRPFLPWDGTWAARPPGVKVVPAHGSAQWSTRARFIQRGEHHIDSFSAAQLVVFGLALGAKVRGHGTRFLVVPRPAPVASVAVAVRPRIRLGGTAHRTSGGDATELIGVRPYRPGDPVRDLHARTWARAGAPHVRQYQQERVTRVAVVIDLTDENAAEEVVEALVSLCAGVVAHLAQGDVVVDVLVLDAEPTMLTVGFGVAGPERVLDRLAVATRGKDFSADEVIEHWGGRAEELCAMVLLTTTHDEGRFALTELAKHRGLAVRGVRLLRDAQPEASADDWCAVTVDQVDSGEPITC